MRSKDKTYIIAGGNFITVPLNDFAPNLSQIIGTKILIKTVTPEATLQYINCSDNILSQNNIFAIFLKLDRFFYDANDTNGFSRAKEYINAIANLSKAYRGEIFVFLCPSSTHNKQIEEVEKLTIDLSKAHDFLLFHQDDLLSLYQTSSILSSHTEHEAQIPYTPEFYKALSTYLIRNYYAFYNTHKVIVIDCDNTLWSGICGEDDISEISVSPAQAMLQKKLVEKYHQGFLICLCSNNNKLDVIHVFDNHQDMILKMDHITQSKIDWSPKYQRIAELSDELNLDLESFIFIDDNPIEIEQAQRQLPAVTTIHWQNNIETPKHIWAFDKLKQTDEDKIRAASYKHKATFESLKKSSTSQEDFLKTIQMKIDIRKAADFERLSQLSYRVNQFRFNNERFSASQLKKIALQPNTRLYEINLEDRFGSYGIIGFIYINLENYVNIKEFLLSCRSLGRDVELSAIHFVQDIARENNIEYVSIHAQENERNIPALSFLQRIQSCEKDRQKNKIRLTINSNHPISLDKEAKLTSTIQSQLTENIDDKTQYNAISNHHWSFAAEKTVMSSSKTSMVEQLVAIWATLFQKDYDPNTPFTAQATSIELVFFIGKIYETLGISLPLSKVYEYNTIKELIENSAQSNLSHHQISISDHKHYNATISQSLFKMSEDIYKESIYDGLHIFSLKNIAIETLKHRLTLIIQSIPELHSAINDDLSVHVLSKEHTINTLERGQQNMRSFARELKEQQPDHHFWIIGHQNNNATVLCWINHAFFDQFSVETYIEHLLVNGDIHQNSSLSYYSQLEQQLFDQYADNNTHYFYEICKQASPFTIPTKNPRKNIYTSSSIKKYLKPNTYKELLNIRTESGYSLFEIVFSAFTYTLSYYNNMTDPVMIGTALSTRDLIPGNNTQPFGPLFNTVPITFQSAANKSLAALIKENATQLKYANKHKVFNLSTLIKQLKLKHLPGKHPIFPVLFVWNEKLYKKEQICDYEFIFEKTEFDIILYIKDTGDNLEIRIDYAKELFSLSQMHCFMDIFDAVLNNTCKDTFNTALNPHSIIPDNYLPRYYPHESYKRDQGSIVKDIEHSIDTYSEKTAIISPTVSISYNELDTQIDSHG